MDNLSLAQSGDRAVVIGGSIAGSLAARALSSSYEHVTVFDRDVLPARPEARRGVPQSRHLHLLLARGAEGLEALFPGFLDKLTAYGAATGDIQSDISWYVDGRRLAEGTAGLRTYGVTRPLIEHLIRQRVRALPNVAFVEQAEVTGLTEGNGRVRGVHVRQQPGSAEEETVPAALVVDATGRAARSRTWLGELGYPVPEQTVIRTDVVYVSRQYRPDPRLLTGRLGVLLASSPGRLPGGAFIRQENGGITVTLSARLGLDVPTDDAGMLAHAESLAGDEIADVLRSGTPAGPPVKMRYPGSSLSHFEKLDRHMEGLLVVGDALCYFNPVYGQGISVAVMEAQLLETLAEAGGGGISSRFSAEAAKLLVEPWTLAAGSDLRYDEVVVERPPEDRGSLTPRRIRGSASTSTGSAPRRRGTRRWPRHSCRC